MADVNEPLSSEPTRTNEMLEAFKSGAEPAVGASTTEQPLETETSEASFDLHKFMEEGQSEDPETEESTESELSAESTDSPEEEPGQAQETSDIEEISVSTDKGRRKVKVDFTDREKIKKQIALAYGARKWQKQKDDAVAEKAELQKKYSELETDWQSFEQAFAEDSFYSLIDRVEGRAGAWQDFVREASKRLSHLESMSPEEQELHQLKQRNSDWEAEKQRLKDEFEAKLSEVKTEREKAELRTIESKLHPAFDRYRFDGKLGDPVAEHQIDEAIWNQALSNLEKIQEADPSIELTQAIVDKEFRKVSAAFKKVFSSQADKKLKSSISKKKQAAATKAQSKASKGMRSNTEVDEFRKNMRAGNFVDGLKNFVNLKGGKF